MSLVHQGVAARSCAATEDTRGKLLSGPLDLASLAGLEHKETIELMEEYMKDANFKNYQPESFVNDVFSCSKNEIRDAKILHRHVISEWAKMSSLKCACSFEASADKFLVCNKCSYHVCHQCAIHNQYYTRNRHFKCPKC